MFEDEIKMEEKNYNIVPLLMALGLAVAIVGGIAYFIMESKRTYTPQEATQMVTSVLQAQGPAKVHFHTGFVEPTVDEKPYDPHYKLLAKAGVIKTGKLTYKGMDVTLTPEGKKLIEACGATLEKTQDGHDSYTVPLAQRKLIKVGAIEMVSPGLAKFDYEWNWEPNQLGLAFDAKSPEMASMTQWDAATLIQKYGADFYKNSEPKKVTMRVMWDDKAKTWKPYVPE